MTLSRPDVRQHQSPRPGWRVVGAGLLALSLGGLGLSRSGCAQDTAALALVDQVITAHGGMRAWDTLQDLRFTVTSVNLAPHGDVVAARVGLYALKRPDKIRVESLTGKGLLIQGFDGQLAWVTLDGKPDTSEEALKRAHFQSVNWWYWMGIPFKLKDPGVILRSQGTATIQGISAEVLDVTFQPGVGYTSDHFVYYIDPETWHIRAVEVQLQPGVWPGVTGGAPSWQGWLDYKRVGPFTLHTRRVSYTSADLTEKRGIAIFGDFQLNTGLSDRLFRAP